MHIRIQLLLDQDGLVLSREHPELVSSLKRLRRAGSLVSLYPGVFADPLRLTKHLRLLALCRSVPHGVLHGRTAAALWLEEPLNLSIDLAVRSRVGPRDGVVQTVRRIPAEQVRGVGSLVVASPAYCAAELAASDDGRVATRLLRERRVSVEELQAAGKSLFATPGNAARQRVLRSLGANPWSHAERLLHQLLLRAGVGGWVANQSLRLENRRVTPDVLFDEQRLVLEVDGFAHHSSAADLQRDHERQNLLVSAGYRVLRFTWIDVTERAEALIARVRASLHGPDCHPDHPNWAVW